MSLIKAVKWFAIYVLLTLVFTALTALGTFMYLGLSEHVRAHYEFDTLFFFFLFLVRITSVLLGVLIVIQAPYLTKPELGW